MLLNFLRYGKLVVDDGLYFSISALHTTGELTQQSSGISLDGVYEEAQFFQLKSLLNIFSKHPIADFTRRQVVSKRGGMCDSSSCPHNLTHRLFNFRREVPRRTPMWS